MQFDIGDISRMIEIKNDLKKALGPAGGAEAWAAAIKDMGEGALLSFAARLCQLLDEIEALEEDLTGGLDRE